MRPVVIVRYAAIAASVGAALLFSAPTMAQTPDRQVDRIYGLGLPRDGDVLFIPDDKYPDWPLRPDQMDYADVNGDRMKEWVRRFSAIALQSQADGNMYWGRLPGTAYDAMTMNLMIDEFERSSVTNAASPPVVPPSRSLDAAVFPIQPSWLSDPAIKPKRLP